MPYYFSSDPRGTTGLYVHRFFPDYISGSSDFGKTVTGSYQSIYYGSYSNAFTPWIISQYQSAELFKVHTISDGTLANT